MRLNSFKIAIVSCSFSLFRHGDSPFFQSEIKNVEGCLCGTLHETALNRKQLSVGFPVSWLESICCSVKDGFLLFTTESSTVPERIWVYCCFFGPSCFEWSSFWVLSCHGGFNSGSTANWPLKIPQMWTYLGEKTCTREGLVKIGVGIGVMQWRAKECLELPETIWGKETLSPWP